MHTTLQPPEWARPKGYANGVLARGGETIYTGGLIGWDANCEFPSGDFVDQVVAEGRGAGGGPTASAVVADLIDIARGTRLATFAQPAASRALKPTSVSS